MKKAELLGRKEIVALIVVAAFIASFYLVSTQRASEYSLEGLKIISGEQPKVALARILSGNSFLIEEQLFEGVDERNTAVAIVGAEVSSALAAHNKTSFAYGVVGGVPSINCNANTSNCSGANIILGIGNCDCIRLSDKIEIFGSKAFLQDNAVKIRGVFRLVLNEVAPTPIAVKPSATPTPIVNESPPEFIPQCKSDADCASALPKCGTREAIANVTSNVSESPEFSCFEQEKNLTHCGCIAGRCAWERTKAFCDCGLGFNKTFNGC